MPQNDSFLKYPVLKIRINGKQADSQPSVFSLATDAALPQSRAVLVYPKDASTGKKGDAVTVSLAMDGKESLLFTGEIVDVKPRGVTQDVNLTDGFKKLCAASVTPAYRKEKASVILADTLSAAGITKTQITCPAVTLARFSTTTISGERCVALLVDALAGHGVDGVRYFFDAEDVFHFGTVKDTGKNNGDKTAFESGKNIIKRGAGWIEVFPAAIRHSQEITVDGVAMRTVRTQLTISRSRSRLLLYVEAA